VAVDGVDFSVKRGEVFGFLGPNGAGKSSTMRMDRLRFHPAAVATCGSSDWTPTTTDPRSVPGWGWSPRTRTWIPS